MCAYYTPHLFFYFKLLFPSIKNVLPISWRTQMVIFPNPQWDQFRISSAHTCYATYTHTHSHPPIIFYAIKHNPLFRVVPFLLSLFYLYGKLVTLYGWNPLVYPFFASKNSTWWAVWICVYAQSYRTIMHTLVNTSSCEHEHMGLFSAVFLANLNSK